MSCTWSKEPCLRSKPRFAYPARRASSSLVSCKRGYLRISEYPPKWARTPVGVLFFCVASIFDTTLYALACKGSHLSHKASESLLSSDVAKNLRIANILKIRRVHQSVCCIFVVTSVFPDMYSVSDFLTAPSISGACISFLIVSISLLKLFCNCVIP